MEMMKRNINVLLSGLENRAALVGPGFRSSSWISVSVPRQYPVPFFSYDEQYDCDDLEA